MKSLFDAEWYLARNPDVAAAGVDPLTHYFEFGAAEGRDPHPLFDSDWYLAQNPDVAAAGMNPLQHYLEIGSAEGRDPNPLFDTDWYLARNPDAAAGPLTHFLAIGAANGRDPSAHFNTRWYLDVNPDVARSGINPLIHYLMFGASEGRWPQPRPKPPPPRKPHAQAKMVIAHRGDGLGTRLLTILYGRIFAEMMGFDFRVMWPQQPLPFYADERLLVDTRRNLFRNDWIFEGGGALRGDFIAGNAMGTGRTLHLSNEEGRIAVMDHESFQGFVEEFDTVLYESPHCLTKFMRYECDLPSEVRRLWKSVSWNPDITDCVDKISRDLALDGCIAVHIRRGDIVNKIAEADVDHLRGETMIQIMHRYTPIRSIMDKIDSIRTGEKIILCCEDRDTEQSFVRRYGADTVRLSSELFRGPEDQRAIIDLMLLSRAKILIAPFISIFSKCAAQVGDCTYMPLEMNLPLIVEELLKIADRIDGERKARVRDLIRDTAAMLSEQQGQNVWLAVRC